MKPIRRSLMVISMAAAMAACGSTPAATNDASVAADSGTGSDAGTGGDAGTANDLGPGADVPTGLVMIRGLFADGSMPVAGATIEVVGASPANSTMTSASGAWSLMVQGGSSIFVRASKAGFRTVQTGVQVPADGLRDLDLTVVPNALPMQLFAETRITENAAAGIVVLSFFVPPVDSGTRPSGFGATLSAGGGTRVALGNGPPTVRDTTVGDEEQTLLIINVAAGMTTVTPTAPAGASCTPNPGALTTIRVDPQVLSFITFQCR